MESPISIIVLEKSQPFARLIEAYNPHHFRHSNRRDFLSSVFYAIYATSIVVFTPILIFLVMWCVFRNDPTIEKLAVAIPISLSLSQTGSTFLVMLWQNAVISAAMKRLQNVVNHRECSSTRV